MAIPINVTAQPGGFIFPTLSDVEDWRDALIDHQVVDIKETKEGIHHYAIFTTSDGIKTVLREDIIDGFRVIYAKDIVEISIDGSVLSSYYTKLKNVYDYTSAAIEQMISSAIDYRICQCAKKVNQLMEKNQSTDLTPDPVKDYINDDCEILLPDLPDFKLGGVKCKLVGPSFSAEADPDITGGAGYSLPCWTDDSLLKPNWKDLLIGQKILDIRLSKDDDLTVVFFECQGGLIVPVSWDKSGFKLVTLDMLFNFSIDRNFKPKLITVYPEAEKVFKQIGKSVQNCIDKIKNAMELNYCSLPELSLNLPELILDIQVNLGVNLVVEPPKLVCNFRFPGFQVKGYGYDENGNFQVPVEEDIQVDEETDQFIDDYCSRFPKSTQQDIQLEQEKQAQEEIETVEKPCDVKFPEKE